MTYRFTGATNRCSRATKSMAAGMERDMSRQLLRYRVARAIYAHADFELLSEKDKIRLLYKADNAIRAVERHKAQSFFRRASAVTIRWLGVARNTPELTRQSARSRRVRLHPLPEGASGDLAYVIGSAVAGGLRSFLSAHEIHLSKSQKGMLIGSTRKRVVNQLVCREGEQRLREALNV